MDQFVFGEDAAAGRFVRFLGKQSKNNRGGLQHRHVAVKDLKQYDSNFPKSTYKLIQTYFEALKRCGIQEGAFYRRPLQPIAGKIRYAKVPIGVNSISQLLPNAAAAAGLKGNFTGHSGKVSCATALFQSDVDEQLIKERTGHRSDAVRIYKRTAIEQQRNISRLLDYSPSNKKVTTMSTFHLSLTDKNFSLIVLSDLI